LGACELVAWWSGDIAVVRPAAFHVVIAWRPDGRREPWLDVLGARLDANDMRGAIPDK
jgi:hypothetical protein